MGPRRIAIASALLCLCAASTARAQVEEAANPRWAIGDFTVGSISTGADDLTLLGLTLGGGYMFGDSFGVGGRLPLAHARTNADSGTALGNLTADVFYVFLRRQSESPDAWTGRAWFRGSFSAPTATDSELNEIPASAAFTGFWLPDPGLYHPDGMTFRAGGRGYFSRGKLFVDSELDVQLVVVGNASQNLTDEDITNMVLRLGGGYRLTERISGFGSLSNAWRGNAPDTTDKFLHWIDLGLSLAGQNRGTVRAFVYVPLDSNARDLGIVGFGVSVGLAL